MKTYTSSPQARLDRRGFTLIEAVLSLGIMSIILLVVGAFIVQNQRIAFRNLMKNESTEDSRRTVLRLSEIISQAGYIYPNAQTLTLPSGTATTGNSALALLVPWGSPFCQGDATHKAHYCAFLYQIESRSSYTAQLPPMTQGGGSVLFERKYGWVDWPTQTLPPTNWSALQSQGSGVVTDGVVVGESVLGNLTLLSGAGGVDTPVLVGTAATDNDALIGAVRPKLVLSYYTDIKVPKEVDIAARAIPRITEPGVGN